MDQVTTEVLPNNVGEGNAGGVEEAELSERRLGVELDDLEIVADESDRIVEWGAGDFVEVEIDVPPLHRVVEFWFPIITVAEKLPLGNGGLFSRNLAASCSPRPSTDSDSDSDSNVYLSFLSRLCLLNVQLMRKVVTCEVIGAAVFHITLLSLSTSCSSVFSPCYL
ncbi:hypothetical protein CMV_028395 [Castanea mollissima]|uniref:Uncharacterized protein n=1 Tax=Castanea mollissima TaxID=60419 RepID=A0A8J4V8G0_9ROSI|nr:hypothetical protein CMV_028395 [Castanea mollissima]